MRRLVYQVYVGKRSKLYDFCIASVGDYCAAHNISHIVQTEPILKIRPKNSARSSEAVERLGYLPIYEKENALGHLHWFDQVAVIDADVYIRPGSPCVFGHFGPDVDFAGVVEREMPLTEAYRHKIRSYSRGQYDRLHGVDWKWNKDGAEFMNMGVMLMNASLLEFMDGQTPKEFLEREEFAPLVNGVGQWKWSTDQTLLNYWLRRSSARVHHLSWKWNALYSALLPGKVDEAHFVHFFLRDHMPNKGEDIAELVAKW